MCTYFPIKINYSRGGGNLWETDRVVFDLKCHLNSLRFNKVIVSLYL